MNSFINIYIYIYIFPNYSCLMAIDLKVHWPYCELDIRSLYCRSSTEFDNVVTDRGEFVHRFKQLNDEADVFAVDVGVDDVQEPRHLRYDVERFHVVWLFSQVVLHKETINKVYLWYWTNCLLQVGKTQPVSPVVITHHTMTGHCHWNMPCSPWM